MKVRTANAVISKKMAAWQDTLPDELKKLAQRDTVVTGGAIASMLLGEVVRDYDVYFKTYGTAVKMAEHYVLAFKEAQKGSQFSIEVNEGEDIRGEKRVKVVAKSAGVATERSGAAEYQYFEGRPPEEAGAYITDVTDIEETHNESEAAALEQEGGKYRPVFLSSNAITLSDKVQLVLRFYGSPDEIHNNYDFVHCTNYWTKQTGVVLKAEALECLLTRELIYKGSRYPVASLIRTRKFIQRGWSINAGQYFKMAYQMSHLDLNDFNVLEDQLTGVDMAYFAEVLDKLKEKGDQKVDHMYLLELIDRMF